MRNILITSAGRRVALVNIFREAAAKIDGDIRVLTADINPRLSPACRLADAAFEMPACCDPHYLDRLLDICRDEGVAIVVPTIDTGLVNLAAAKPRFEREGVHVIVPTAEYVAACRDKRLTAECFRRHGIRIPEPIDIAHPRFPLFVKPYDGSSSLGTYVIHNADDLSETLRHDPKLMFMEYINRDEYIEYSVDMYFGRDNRLKALVPRERIATRSGEVSKSKTCKNRLVDLLKRRVSHVPGLTGVLCVQFFYRESDNDLVGLEINPRFGGGYPLSYRAGVDFAGMILREYLLNDSVDYDEGWRDNLLMLRYDAELFIQE